MDRFQKKCFVASTGIHLLLLLCFLTGSAFVANKPPKPDNMPIIEFIAFKTTDADVAPGGGSPHVKPPAAPIVAPPVIPPPAPAAKEPEKVVEEAPEPKPKPRAVEPAKPEPPKDDPEETLVPSSTKRRKEITLKPIIRNSDAKAKAKAKEQAEAQAEQDRQAKAYADRRNRLAKAFGRAATSLNEGLSSGTDITLVGPGGGGVPYANFLQAVKSRYANAWIVPDGVTDNDATTMASVTIARDGTVLSARIIRSSGNAGVDRSVRSVLDRVKWAAPLPDDAKERERTVEIGFNVGAKRGLG